MEQQFCIVDEAALVKEDSRSYLLLAIEHENKTGIISDNVYEKIIWHNNLFASGEIEYAQAEQLILGAYSQGLAGISALRLFEANKKFAEENFLSLTRPAFRHFVQEAKNQKITVILISSMPSHMAIPLGKYLSISDNFIISSEMPSNQVGNYTGSIRPINQEEIERELTKRGVSRRNTRVFFAKRAKYLKVMAWATYPVAVNPEKDLRSEAVIRSWDIINESASFSTLFPFLFQKIDQKPLLYI